MSLIPSVKPLLSCTYPRKGDKVYEVLDENITMLKDTASGASIAEPQEKLDEVASGESLFKVRLWSACLGSSKLSADFCL